MVVKSYRGLLADGGQDRIRLSTNNGKTGYRIIKLQVINELPGTTTCESVVKVYKIKQSTIDATVDFTDNNTLAATYYTDQDNPQYTGFIGPIIFDNEIFNQDIYVTSVDTDSAVNMNYYLELEVIPLSELGAEYTILKDLRERGV